MCKPTGAGDMGSQEKLGQGFVSLGTHVRTEQGDSRRQRGRVVWPDLLGG